MKYISFIAVLALVMILAGPASAVGTTYNQTFTDDDNGGSNIWASITAGYYTYWAEKGGSQILVINTSTTASKNGINVTLHSGPFLRGSLGDQVYTLTANRTYILGPFDLSRFKQANETLLFQSNATRGKAISISVTP